MAIGRPTHPAKFLSAEEAHQVKEAIGDAEKRTSAEIKLVVARHCWGDIYQKARHIFVKHELDKTERRNAVLILLIVTNREFLIYGDQGIHQKVGQTFWDDVRNVMFAIAGLD